MEFGSAINVVNHRQWRELAGRFRDDNYQQGWSYGRALAARHHARCEHVAIQSAGELLGATCVRLRSIPFVGGGVAYITGGPLTRGNRQDDNDRLALALELLRVEYVQRRGLALRILPPLGSPGWNRSAGAIFRRAAFEPTNRARSYRTFLLDIDRPLEAIRAGCSKYWRRNLRRAEQRSFNVRAGFDRELFDPICTLYAGMRQRKSFDAPLDASFYASLQIELEGDERYFATLVEMDGAPTAGLIVSMHGDTCVPLVLAADESGLRNYAAYQLQWQSIVDARERGMRFYDLGGIDPVGNKGVYDFKKGLRGLDMSAPGPFEVMPEGMAGAVTRTAEHVYRRLKKAA